MAEEHFPEKFDAVPKICYIAVADFSLHYRNEWHYSLRSDLIYIISGNMTVMLPGELKYSVKPGEVLAMAGDIRHKDIFKTNKGIKALIVSYLWAGDKDFFSCNGENPVRKFSAEQLQEVHWQLERMRETFEPHPLGTEKKSLLSESRLHTVLLLLYNIMRGKTANRKENTPTYRAKDLLRAAENYIQLNYSSPTLNRTEVAVALNVSVPTLSRAFERFSGYTFLEYLTQVRLDAAKKLLLDGSCRVSEVAQLCGFADPGYFTRIFKKNFGTTPGKYK